MKDPSLTVLAAPTLTPDRQSRGSPARACVEALEGRRLLCFSAPVVSPGGGDSPAVADFNHDGRDDVAVFAAKGRVGVSLSNGDGTFRQSAALSGVTGTPWMLGVGDVNGDGRRDVRAWSFRSSTSKSPGGRMSNASMTSSDGISPAGACLQGTCGGTPTSPTGTLYLSTWLGNGDGTFGAAGTTSSDWWYGIPAGPSNAYSTEADLNRDGILDVASLYGSSTGVVSVYLGGGDGTYQQRQSYPAGPTPGSIASGDFNGDGWVDLVVVNSLGSRQPTLSVLINDAAW